MKLNILTVMSAAHAPLARPPADPLAALNEAQRAAACWGVQAGAAPAPPLLVIAGAGTGKTATLAHRVARLIAGGADPGRILLLTFSRRAADEMGRRVRGILGQRGAQAGSGLVTLPWSGTFHAVGARLLRDFSAAIGLDPAFTIHDREDSADLMDLVRHELELSASRRRFPQKATCLAIYSATVNGGLPLADVLRQSFPWCAEWADELRRLFGAYVLAKQAQQVLDYDDLLLYWAQMVAEPELGAEVGGLFDHVLVDEYQDTNPLQAAILLGMKPDGRGLTVVGDDAQSIYGFRGATVRNILDFPSRFSPPAEVLKLEQNYRSTVPILAAANAVIALAGEGYAKTLWSARASSCKPRLVAVKDDADQAAFVVETILARREEGLALRQQAVLFRASAHSARLELELARRNLPFVKFGGLRFLEAAHVKDVLALLRWAENPRDRVSGFRVLQLLAGIGPKTAGRILDNLVAAAPGCGLLGEQPVPAAAQSAWADFATLIERLRGSEGALPWPADFELACRWYEAEMPRLYEDAALRLLDVQQLGRLAATCASREAFLTDLTLDPPSASSDEAGAPLLDEDYLILSTMHSAKGQEWKAVSVLNVVDGCIPSDIATRNSAEIDEECRLLYVAMTRARDQLDLIVPQRFYVGQQAALGDRHVYAGRSRFIPNRLLGHFEQLSWPPPPAELRGTPASRQAAIDLAARMRDMWR